MKTCPECDFVSHYGREDFHAFGCSKDPSNQPPTSPDKNWKKEFDLRFGADEDSFECPFHEPIRAFISATLENQKKEVLAVLEGLRRSSQTYSEEVATHNMALDEAITKITNL